MPESTTTPRSFSVGIDVSKDALDLASFPELLEGRFPNTPEGHAQIRKLLAPHALTAVVIEATGRCPPEDVGGPPGYEEFHAAIADPRHERHAEMCQCSGETSDPKAVDTEVHVNALAPFAGQWARKAALHARKPPRRDPDRRLTVALL